MKTEATTTFRADADGQVKIDLTVGQKQLFGGISAALGIVFVLLVACHLDTGVRIPVPVFAVVGAGAGVFGLLYAVTAQYYVADLPARRLLMRKHLPGFTTNTVVASLDDLVGIGVTGQRVTYRDQVWFHYHIAGILGSGESIRLSDAVHLDDVAVLNGPAAELARLLGSTFYPGRPGAMLVANVKRDRVVIAYAEA